MNINNRTTDEILILYTLSLCILPGSQWQNSRTFFPLFKSQAVADAPVARLVVPGEDPAAAPGFAKSA